MRQVLQNSCVNTKGLSLGRASRDLKIAYLCERYSRDIAIIKSLRRDAEGAPLHPPPPFVRKNGRRNIFLRGSIQISISLSRAISRFIDVTIVDWRDGTERARELSRKEAQTPRSDASRESL